MAYDIDLIEEVNKSFREISPKKLLSIKMPPSVIKKNKSLYNEGVIRTYEKFKDMGIQMNSIILSQHNYFEFEWLVSNILSKEVIDIIKNEY
jgi:hypothetical protein